MIYLKRFLYIIVMIIILIVFYTLHILQIITTPIWGFIYYVIKGIDPLIAENFFLLDWGNFILNWYSDKFGPK